MYSNMLKSTIPIVFKKAANNVLNYLHDKNNSDIYKYIEKINNARYFIFEKDQKRSINFLYWDKFKPYKIKEDYIESFAGICIRKVIGVSSFKLINIVILDKNYISIENPVLYEETLNMVAIHEIIHLISTNLDGYALLSGFNIFRINKDRKNNLYELNCYNSLNEALTESFTFEVYKYTNNKDFELDYINSYYISSNITMILNNEMYSGDVYKVYEQYLNNNKVDYEKKLDKFINSNLYYYDKYLYKCEKLISIEMPYLEEHMEDLVGTFISRIYAKTKNKKYIEKILKKKYFNKILLK